MKDLLKRLTSRKFLLALSAIIVLVANQQWTELVAVVLGYLGSEGLADTVGRYSTTKFVEAPIEKVKATDSFFSTLDDDDDDIDRNKPIVPGE